ncbi:hypothetical protein AAG570_004360 [Ranatra chinensis]|uniref:Uncharacterized protein n=1 Tax=Ranatra chinensis TaxID=642074 RepID=A0ABD0Y0M0_9HEMI
MTCRDASDQAFSCLSSLGFRLFANTLAHPFDYAKVLIQIGHEPLPPYPTTTFFGRKVNALPNVFKYVKHIKTVDGWSGCYRGLAPRLASQIVGVYSLRATVKYFKVNEDLDPMEDEMSDEEMRSHFVDTLTRDVVGRTVSIVASHPFQVIALRTMAQFVGGEEKYSGILASIAEIYREQGVSGFFSGLVPRWIGEIATLVIASTVSFALTAYVLQERELKSFTSLAIQYTTSALTYPFIVVTSCMAVNNCGLVGGMPPQMPIYSGWSDCWRDLSRKGQLNRGSTLLWRYCFSPPQSPKLAIK